MNERDFLDRLRAIARDPVARGLTDDAAVYGDLVITHDMMVAGTHFPLHADPADVAWKLVGVNLSDLAAKGAAPLGVVLGFMLGDDAWDSSFVDGLAEALSHYDTALWGGDTVAAPAAHAGARALGLTAIGKARHLPVPSRSGARPGDSVWVTGIIGLAHAGFLHDVHGSPASEAAIARFRRPTPRAGEGAALAPQVTAMMDVSDGLLLDATRLAAASAVTLSLESGAIPLPPAIEPANIAAALRWGDDYELLFTLPPGIAPAAEATCIGEVLSASATPLLIDGRPPSSDQPLGWQHQAPQA